MVYLLYRVCCDISCRRHNKESDSFKLEEVANETFKLVIEGENMVAFPVNKIELNVNNKKTLTIHNAEIECSAMLLGGNPVYPRINFKWGASELSIPIENYRAEVKEETAKLNITVSKGWESVFLNLS